jgi:hypothetical protein
MSWFKKLLGIVAGESPKDYIFVPNVERAGAPVAAIQPDEVYVEMYVDSLRIDKARSFATRFHGVVYSFASLAKLGAEGAAFASVTKPDKLAELDKDSIGKVLTISKKMMGPVPWRGGQFELQLGLFSVKSGNVLTPLLNFVTKVSETAGIAFIGAAKPFLPLISEGMDLIAGQTEDTKLVVGLDTTLSLVETCTCAVIAASKDSIDHRTIAIDPADGKLLINGAPLDAAYCVFSIRTTDRKPDFGEIPELKAAYASFRDDVVKGKEEDALEAFTAFRRIALTSPDLISKDASRLIAMTKAMLDEAFPPVDVVLRGPAVPAREELSLPKSLAGLALYD